VDKMTDREDAHIKLMKNLGNQFDNDDEQEIVQKESVRTSKRPPDVILEQSNDSYSQRFCMLTTALNDVISCAIK